MLAYGFVSGRAQEMRDSVGIECNPARSGHNAVGNNWPTPRNKREFLGSFSSDSLERQIV